MRNVIIAASSNNGVQMRTVDPAFLMGAVGNSLMSFRPALASSPKKEATPSEKKSEPLTVASHKEVVVNLMDENYSDGWSDIGGVFNALRYGIFKIQEAETLGQSKDELKPVRVAHRKRVELVMAKLHDCSEVEAGTFAREWLVWTSAELKLPRDQQADERNAPGLTAPQAEPPVAPTTPTEPPRYTELNVRALLVLTQRPEATARQMVQTIAANGYTANEKGVLHSEIIAMLTASFRKEGGLGQTDAERKARALVEPKPVARRIKAEPPKGAPRYEAPQREHATSHEAPIEMDDLTVSVSQVFERFASKHVKLTHEQRVARAAAFATDLKAGAMKPKVEATKKKGENKPQKKQG